MRTWREARDARDARIDAGRSFLKPKLVKVRDVVPLLEAIIRPGDRVCLEGDNQKQTDLLAQCLAPVFVYRDLTPNVALIAAVSADCDGNLYTAPSDAQFVTTAVAARPT